MRHPIFRSFYKRSKKLLPIFKNKNNNQEGHKNLKKYFMTQQILFWT